MFLIVLVPFICRLQDLAGYGVFLATAKEFADSFPDRTFKSPLVELLVKSGRNGNIYLYTIYMNQSILSLLLTFMGTLGKNNGKGFYLYEKGSRPKPDPKVLPIIEESRRLTNTMPGGKVVIPVCLHLVFNLWAYLFPDNLCIIYSSNYAHLFWCVCSIVFNLCT